MSNRAVSQCIHHNENEIQLFLNMGGTERQKVNVFVLCFRSPTLFLLKELFLYYWVATKSSQAPVFQIGHGVRYVWQARRNQTHASLLLDTQEEALSRSPGRELRALSAALTDHTARLAFSTCLLTRAGLFKCLDGQNHTIIFSDLFFILSTSHKALHIADHQQMFMLKGW